MNNKNFQIDFLGIGAPRCATTWIYECLREHPRIELLPKDEHATAPFLNRGAMVECHFKRADSLKGVFNVFYLSMPKEKIALIKEHNPEMKFIVSLRSPVERAYSHYKHINFVEDKNWSSLRQAIEESPERIIEPGFYYKHISKYLDFFGIENFLILFYEKDIKNNPKGTIKRVYEFLDIREKVLPKLGNVVINPSNFKYTAAGKIMHKRVVPRLRSTKLGKKVISFDILKRIYYGLSGRINLGDHHFAPLTQKEISYLKNIYKEDIKKLESLLGQDLTAWK